MKKLKEYLRYFIGNNFLVFIFLAVLILFSFGNVFNSYFEADEWFHFAHYLPMTNNPHGFLSVIFSAVADTDALSRGQHIVPIGEEIFFLNTLLFGTNYIFYALFTIILHSLNSFLVFILIKVLLNSKKKYGVENFYAFIGSIFFAFSQIHFHAIEWAAFYGQNNLSVTFFLFSIIFLAIALNVRKKKFIYLSLLFLFLDLFTKETGVALFLVLPTLVLIRKKVFSFKYLAKLLIFSLIIFALFRFLLPFSCMELKRLVSMQDQISSIGQPIASEDEGTIVSSDTSIHKNIYMEVFYRAIRFPLKMTSEYYFPRDTILSSMKIIGPLIYPLPDNIRGAEEVVKSQNYAFFINGPGNDLIIYILSIWIIIATLISVKNLNKKGEANSSQALIFGLAIIFFSALLLAFIVLSFPRWGYDTYLDSRHYYMGSVGAAILFPFLLHSVGGYVSNLAYRLTHKKIPVVIIFSLLFSAWLVNNYIVLNSNFDIIINNGGYPRKQIVAQLKKIIPTLPEKIVFYIQTDGLGAYGESLPFLTSVPQVLTVVYYDQNHLPDSFFDKFVLNAKPQGYVYSEGRGFGFYNSRELLKEALLSENFSVKDIYGFYYNSQEIRLNDITKKIRAEMRAYLDEEQKN